MNMTPKKVLANFFAVPLYSTSGIITLLALLFLVPGGIAVVGALLLAWLADRLTTGHFDDHIDTTIEEYESRMSRGTVTYGDIIHRSDKDNDQQWADFYNDPVFMDVPKGPRTGGPDDEEDL
jgi:hypothetical protein